MKTARRVKGCHHADEPVSRLFIEPEHFGVPLRGLILPGVPDSPALFGLNGEDLDSLICWNFG